MPQYYTRKKMRLENYDYSEGNTVFVTVCVNERKKLLGRIVEPEKEGELPTIELSEIGKVVDQFTSTIRGIEKYVVMPNHVHMIVTNAEGEDISKMPIQYAPEVTRKVNTANCEALGLPVPEGYEPLD